MQADGLTGVVLLYKAEDLRQKNTASPLPRQVRPEAKADLNIRVFPLYAEKACQFVAAEDGKIAVSPFFRSHDLLVVLRVCRHVVEGVFAGILPAVRDLHRFRLAHGDNGHSAVLRPQFAYLVYDPAGTHSESPAQQQARIACGVAQEREKVEYGPRVPQYNIAHHQSKGVFEIFIHRRTFLLYPPLRKSTNKRTIFRRAPR